jgi:hypothetical protein
MDPRTVTVTTYAEHTDDPKSWASPRPSFDVEKFQKELTRRGGSMGSVPRFRLRWAGEADEYILEEFDVLTGYIYVEGGAEKFVSTSQGDFELPDGAVWSPKYEHTNIFLPRWVIEEFDGLFYQKFWVVQQLEQTGYQSGRVDLLSHYRAPAEADLKVIEGYVHKLDNLTFDEVRNSFERDAKQKEKDAKARKDELVDDFAEGFAQLATDGVKNPTKFGFDPKLKNFDIKTYSKNLLKEHNEK